MKAKLKKKLYKQSKYKTLTELAKTLIRKLSSKPQSTHKDKTKYTRKKKHKRNKND